MHSRALKGNIPNEKDQADLNALRSSAHEGNTEGLRKLSELNEILSNAYDKSVAEADVKTRNAAKVAIRIVDGAIEYSLNEATRMGSYLQRLDFTESNVTTEDESVQNAESTIRDADMAKEMTEYTKQNILSQASQSMLAQANQNLSSVLGLLQ